MNLTVTQIPINWKPDNKKAFLEWVLKIKNIHYTKIK